MHDGRQDVSQGPGSQNTEGHGHLGHDDPPETPRGKLWPRLRVPNSSPTWPQMTTRAAGHTHLGPRLLHVAFLQVVPGQLRHQLEWEMSSAPPRPGLSRPPCTPVPSPTAKAQRPRMQQCRCGRFGQGSLGVRVGAEPAPSPPRSTGRSSHSRPRHWPLGRPPAGSGSGQRGGR